MQWEAAQREDTVLLLAHVLHRATRLGTSFIVLFNKADQVDTDSKSVLEQELQNALDQINKKLDLALFRPFVQRATEVLQQHSRRKAHPTSHPSGSNPPQPSTAPSLSDVAELCFREQVLSPRQRPSEFQMRLLTACGALGYEADLASEPESVRELWNM